MRVKIIATGSYLPDDTVTNNDLSRALDTSDEWISSRTGIRERRIEKSGSTSRMAVRAARRAIEAAQMEGWHAAPDVTEKAGQHTAQGVSEPAGADVPPAETGGRGEADVAGICDTASHIDLIIAATSTPDNCFPSCACEVQGAVGAVNAAAFDLSAACTGFLYAFNTAAAYLKAGLAKTALVIGADALSKTLDWTDRSTCVLFGDGAGAVILEAVPDEEVSDLVSVKAGADGAKGDVLRCAAHYHNTGGILQHTFFSAPAETGNVSIADLAETVNEAAEGGASALCDAFDGADKADCVHMDGQAVFRFAVKTVASVILDAVGDEALSDVKYFILHQANIRIIEAAAKRLGQPMEKFPSNLEWTGNTSAASIPILLDELNRAGKLARGDKLVLAGFGAGLTYGASLIVF